MFLKPRIFYKRGRSQACPLSSRPGRKRRFWQMVDQRPGFGDSLRSWRGSVTAMLELCQLELSIRLLTHNLPMAQLAGMPETLGQLPVRKTNHGWLLQQKRRDEFIVSLGTETDLGWWSQMNGGSVRIGCAAKTLKKKKTLILESKGRLTAGVATP